MRAFGLDDEVWARFYGGRDLVAAGVVRPRDPSAAGPDQAAPGLAGEPLPAHHGLPAGVVASALAEAARLSGQAAADARWFERAAREVGLDYLRLASGQDPRGSRRPWGMTLLVELLARDAAEPGPADLGGIARRVRALRADALLPGHGLPEDVAAAVMALSQDPRTLEAVVGQDTWQLAMAMAQQPELDPDRDRFGFLARSISLYLPSIRGLGTSQLVGLLGLAVPVFAGTDALQTPGAAERLADLWRLADLVRARPGGPSGTVTMHDLARAHQELFGFPRPARGVDHEAVLRLLELMRETRRAVTASRRRADPDRVFDVQVTWDDLYAAAGTDHETLLPLPMPWEPRSQAFVFENLVTFESEEIVLPNQALYERYRADPPLVIVETRGAQGLLPDAKEIAAALRRLRLVGEVPVLLRGVEVDTGLDEGGQWAEALAYAHGAPVSFATRGDVRPDGVHGSNWRLHAVVPPYGDLPYTPARLTEEAPPSYSQTRPAAAAGPARPRYYKAPLEAIEPPDAGPGTAPDRPEALSQEAPAQSYAHTGRLPVIDEDSPSGYPRAGRAGYRAGRRGRFR